MLKSPFTYSDCDIAPKSNLLFWWCTVTPSNCDVTAMLLGNHFVDASLSLVNGLLQRERGLPSIIWATRIFAVTYCTISFAQSFNVVYFSFYFAKRVHSLLNGWLVEYFSCFRFVLITSLCNQPATGSTRSHGNRRLATVLTTFFNQKFLCKKNKNTSYFAVLN